MKEQTIRSDKEGKQTAGSFILLLMGIFASGVSAYGVYRFVGSGEESVIAGFVAILVEGTRIGLYVRCWKSGKFLDRFVVGVAYLLIIMICWVGNYSVFSRTLNSKVLKAKDRLIEQAVEVKNIQLAALKEQKAEIERRLDINKGWKKAGDKSFKREALKGTREFNLEGNQEKVDQLVNDANKIPVNPLGFLNKYSTKKYSIPASGVFAETELVSLGLPPKLARLIITTAYPTLIEMIALLYLIVGSWKKESEFNKIFKEAEKRDKVYTFMPDSELTFVQQALVPPQDKEIPLGQIPEGITPLSDNFLIEKKPVKPAKREARGRKKASRETNWDNLRPPLKSYLRKAWPVVGSTGRWLNTRHLSELNRGFRKEVMKFYKRDKRGFIEMLKKNGIVGG
jgi:hypothetical protein